MIKYLPGVTHAIVTVPLKDEAEKTKVYAYVDLHFGPGDDNSIAGIRYVKNESGKLSWESPMYDRPLNNKIVQLPVFRGRVLREICELAAAATSKVKQKMGRSTFGTRYRVLENDVLIEETK